MNDMNSKFFDEKGKVICQVCGKKYMIITPSHLKTHDLKYSQYQEQYPGAPLTNEEFRALSLYSTKKGTAKKKYSLEDIEILGKETIIDEDVPVIDNDFEIPKKQVKKHFDTPMEAKKEEILSFLVTYLPNIIMDYRIEIFDMHDTCLFSSISDFADPVSKIDIEFPKTFWHNAEYGFDDPNRTHRLKQYGWKAITINSVSPKISDIEKKLREIL